MARHRESVGIYRRGSIYWLNYQRDNKRNFISLETEDYAQAVERAAEMRLSPVLNSSDSFKTEIDAFLAHKRRHNKFTASSAHGRGFILRAFARDCGRHSPAQVTPADVQSYYNEKLDAFSATTANSYASILRSFFSWCVQVRHLTRRNPCEGLEQAEELGAKMQPFCTTKQRDALISSCQRDDLLFVHYCGFHAGLRKNEIIEARPFWFDLDAGLLHLRKTTTINFKDREERTVPLTSGFQRFLKEYGLHEPFMLHPEVRHGRNRYRYDFTRPFQEHVRAHDLAWVTPHTMRHTFASLLASAGVSLYKISKWLGDDARVVEERYAGLLPSDPDIERAHSGNSPAARRSQHKSRARKS